MQIGDALGRYNANMQPGTPSAAGAQRSAPTESASAQRTGDISGLRAGNVFEGTVGRMTNGQVQLQLADGSTINARLGADVPITEGQSLFFEVKSNEGGTVEIRPFQAEGGLSNPTILSALDAAGLNATADNMKMVNTLMQEGMSIDRQSLGSMARLIAGNPDINPTTLIEMQKLGIPITNEMAAQFENYKTDSYQILNKMTEILESVSGTLGGEETDGAEAMALHDKLVNILTGDGSMSELSGAAEPEEGAQQAQGVLPQEAEGVASDAEAALKQASSESAAKGTPPETSDAVRNGQPVPEGAQQEALAETTGKTGASAETGAQALKTVQEAAKPVLSEGTQPGKEYAPGTIGELLSGKESAALEKSLQTLNKGGALEKAGLSKDMSAEEFVKSLNEALKTLENPDGKALKGLLSGKEYLSVLKEAVKQQWTVKPEQLSGDRIKDLYENLDRQMKQTETMLKEMGLKDSDLARSVSDLKNNLEFMDQVNQNYTYLQIPLQFQNQTAHSDLYVYTNKKNLQDPNAELTAFLHLDMAHLGSTDVSVRMQNRSVNTRFYMEDDAAFDLIMAHADELAARLEEKGYNCKVEAVNDRKEIDLVEDFMKAGQSAGQMIHRYSFDIKA